MDGRRERRPPHCGKSGERRSEYCRGNASPDRVTQRLAGARRASYCCATLAWLAPPAHATRPCVRVDGCHPARSSRKSPSMHTVIVEGPTVIAEGVPPLEARAERSCARAPPAGAADPQARSTRALSEPPLGPQSLTRPCSLTAQVHLPQDPEPEPDLELEGFASVSPGMAPTCEKSATEGPEPPVRLPHTPLIPSRDLDVKLGSSVVATSPVPPTDGGPNALAHLSTVPRLSLRDQSTHQSAVTDHGQGTGVPSRTQQGALRQSVCEGPAQDASPVWTKSLRRLLEAPVVPPRDDGGRSDATRATGIGGSGTAIGGRPLPPPPFGNDGGVPPPVPPR